MDYITNHMTKAEARKFGQAFRTMFGYDETTPFNPIMELDRIHLFMPNVSYEIVEDNKFPNSVHAICEIDEKENFIIKIKESIYEGARNKNKGGYLMDITHEMVHPYLYKLGYKPTMTRSYRNNSLKAYESIEWQVKAVAGEIMIPYEASKGMNCKEIENTFHVSYDAAKYRINHK